MSLTWLGAAALAVVLLACVAGFRRGFVKEVVSTFFVLFALILSAALQPYVYDTIKEKTPLYNRIQENLLELVEEKTQGQAAIGSGEQEELVVSLGLPSFLEKSLLGSNTSEGYREAGANTFVEYIASSVAAMLVKGVSFFSTYLLATILIRLAVFVLNLFTKFPLVHGVNKLAGALVGAVKGLLFVWLVLLLLTALCSTAVGKNAIALVEKDALLGALYENPFSAQTFLSVLKGF